MTTSGTATSMDIRSSFAVRRGDRLSVFINRPAVVIKGIGIRMTDIKVIIGAVEIRNRHIPKKEKQMASIAIGLDSRMLPGEDSLRNAGYAILKELYKQLDLGSFWNWLVRGSFQTQDNNDKRKKP